MNKDGLSLVDILAVIGAGRAVEEQPDGRYRVEGRTADGEPVVAICKLQETSRGSERVFVSTVWRLIKR